MSYDHCDICEESEDTRCRSFVWKFEFGVTTEPLLALVETLKDSPTL